VRTAVKNGAVFEICYVGSLGGEVPPIWVDARAAEAGAGAKKNWWAGAKELVRVTKGKGVLITSGANNATDLRAPKDVSNL
jgi:ribonuclease P/MRP protein subunit RPP1